MDVMGLRATAQHRLRHRRLRPGPPHLRVSDGVGSQPAAASSAARAGAGADGHGGVRQRRRPGGARRASGPGAKTKRLLVEGVQADDTRCSSASARWKDVCGPRGPGTWAGRRAGRRGRRRTHARRRHRPDAGRADADAGGPRRGGVRLRRCRHDSGLCRAPAAAGAAGSLHRPQARPADARRSSAASARCASGSSSATSGSDRHPDHLILQRQRHRLRLATGQDVELHPGACRFVAQRTSAEFGRSSFAGRAPSTAVISSPTLRPVAAAALPAVRSMILKPAGERFSHKPTPIEHGDVRSPAAAAASGT